MTIRLLTPYDRYPVNAIVTLDAGTEAGLIAGKMAQADTTGGSTYVPPIAPPYSVPAQVSVDASNNVTGIVGRAGAPINFPRLVAQSGVASNLTGSTAETALASIPIPGGMMGPNGSLRITALFSYTNSANAKTLKAKLGATAFGNYSVTTTGNTHATIIIRNRGAANSQVGWSANAPTGFGGASGALTAAGIDTSVDQVLTLTGTLALGTESITLEGYTVEVLPG